MLAPKASAIAARRLPEKIIVPTGFPTRLRFPVGNYSHSGKLGLANTESAFYS
jgi:hypothetical protein